MNNDINGNELICKPENGWKCKKMQEKIKGKLKIGSDVSTKTRFKAFAYES